MPCIHSSVNCCQQLLLHTVQARCQSLHFLAELVVVPPLVSFCLLVGADCLSKWIGESERMLRLLFDQAYAMRPSVREAGDWRLVGDWRRLGHWAKPHQSLGTQQPATCGRRLGLGPRLETEPNVPSLCLDHFL